MFATATGSEPSAANRRWHFWLTFGFQFVSLVAVIAIAQPTLSGKHHDGEFGGQFSGDFDITTNEVTLSVRGMSVTFHDTEPYVTSPQD
jgi:hypothetical protein